MAKTDAFGEFKLDKLDPKSGSYTVKVQHPDHGALEVKATLNDSLYLGEMKLIKASATSRSETEKA